MTCQIESFSFNSGAMGRRHQQFSWDRFAFLWRISCWIENLFVCVALGWRHQKCRRVVSLSFGPGHVGSKTLSPRDGDTPKYHKCRFVVQGQRHPHSTTVPKLSETDFIFVHDKLSPWATHTQEAPHLLILYSCKWCGSSFWCWQRTWSPPS